MKTFLRMLDDVQFLERVTHGLPLAKTYQVLLNADRDIPGFTDLLRHLDQLRGMNTVCGAALMFQMILRAVEINTTIADEYAVAIARIGDRRWRQRELDRIVREGDEYYGKLESLTIRVLPYLHVLLAGIVAEGNEGAADGVKGMKTCLMFFYRTASEG